MEEFLMKQWMKKFISITLVTMLLFTCTITTMPVQTAEAASGVIDVPDGNYYLVNAESGKFVGLENNSTACNSRPVITSKAQVWTIKHRNGHLQFAPYGKTSVTLEVENSKTNNGANVQLYTNDWGYSCKEWTLQDAGAGSVYITNVNSGGVLDVSNGDIGLDGALLWHYWCNGSSAQKFRVVPADTATWKNYISQKAVTVSKGNYKVKSVLAGKYLDVKDGLKDFGVHTQIWQEAGTLNQIFTIESYNGQGHTIIPVHSGLPLEVSGSSMKDGGRIQQYEWANGYPTKIWYFVEATPGYYWVVNSNSLKVMDVSGGSTANGTRVQQYRLNGTTSQIFVLEKNNTVVGSGTDNLANTIYNKAMGTKGNDGRTYQAYYGSSGGDWCVMYAGWCLKTSLLDNGYSDAEIDRIMPSTASTTQLANWFNGKGRYRSFTEWNYKDIHMGINSSASQYQPKVGDFVLIETRGGSDDGPDHTGIVIQVNQDGSFVTMEGNTGSSAKVGSYMYVRSGNTWVREYKKSPVIVHGLCDVAI